ncbi:2519_t:CDS:2, partial [Funneliformis geosporum]
GPPKSTNSDEQSHEHELPESDIRIQYLLNRIKELDVIVETEKSLKRKVDELEVEVQISDKRRNY